MLARPGCDVVTVPGPEGDGALVPEVRAAAAHCLERAARLAARLGLPCAAGAHATEGQLLLLVDENDVRLQWGGRRPPGPVAVEFDHPAMRHRRRGGHNELLGRALGVLRWPGLRVLDATAGLGRDAFVLADLGARVTLCERHPVLALMLEEALSRAVCSADGWLSDAAGRMQLWPAEARSLPADSLREVDAIYLDPMFEQPGRRAAAAKEMSTLQGLLGTCDAGEQAALLRWALSAGVSRVVVKRAIKAPPLGGCAPHHCLRGRAVRFDVYQPQPVGR